jgi:hypothetical protein
LAAAQLQAGWRGRKARIRVRRIWEVKTIILRYTVRGARHFCRTTAASRVRQDAPLSAFLPSSEGQVVEGGDEWSEEQDLHQLLGSVWTGPEFGEDFEQQMRSRPVAIERRICDVAPPAVVARSTLPTACTCYRCGKHVGTDVQTPSDVFTVGFRMGGRRLAVRCLREMAELLEAEDFAEVTRRTACCKVVSCMLAQNRLAAENYEGWFFSTETRVQLKKGTERKDQGLEFSDNCVLLRCFAVQEPRVLTDAQLLALFRWVVAHAQFVQEREKRFIATAMAIVEGAELFGYKFSQPQSFVNKMGAFVRNYAERVIFPHILVRGPNRHKWKSRANILIETAMPKACDVAYALLCVDNWIAQGSPVDASGRREHRIPEDSEHADIFDPHGFESRLKAALSGPRKKYVLRLADAATTNTVTMGMAMAMGTGTGTGASREMHRLQRLVSGSNKNGTTVGHGANGKPTCGSYQNNSSQHPYDRYWGVFKAQGLPDAECTASVKLFVDTHEDGNAVGKERQDPGDPASPSKACAVLRRVERVRPPQTMQLSSKRSALARWRKDQGADGLVKIAKRPRYLPKVSRA